ncbi:MAG: phosphatidylserine decarboxylase [Dokdonella sp.]|nr:MAG: phosphatidylserine decarboxylase [Dokdonella sp.]
MRAAVAVQYLLPHRLLSRLVLWGARCRWRPWKDFLIRRVVAAYDVDLGEAALSDPRAYPNFAAFFTRALKPGARPLPSAQGAIACPADGRISQAGAIVDGRIFQAKGHQFSAAELLGDAAAAAAYASGRFLTVYLSPRDYHRVHMPLDGELLTTVHIPGRLFSVAPFAVAAVPRLFARNERLVCHFRGAHGPFTVVMVGAMLVSGIETVWGGVEVPPYATHPRVRDWNGRGVRLARGDELARFNMGSTVIVLLPAGAPLLAPLAPEQPVRVGQNLASVTDVAKLGQDS